MGVFQLGKLQNNLSTLSDAVSLPNSKEFDHSIMLRFELAEAKSESIAQKHRMQKVFINEFLKSKQGNEKKGVHICGTNSRYSQERDSLTRQ